MTDDLDRLRAAVVTTCRRLAAAGLSPGGSGNVSVRAGRVALVTPTGSALARVLPEELAVVTLPEGAPRSGPHPSKELPLHLARLRDAPDGTAVVHLHAPHATAVACLPPAPDGTAALPAFTPYRVLRLGDVPVVPYAPPGSADLASDIARHPDAPVVLLASHGPVVTAAGLDAAADLAEELENAAQVALLLAGTAARPLRPEQVAALRSRA